MQKAKIKPVEALKKVGWYKISSSLRKWTRGALLTLTGAIMIAVSCTTIRYVPIKGETIVKDSLIVETRIDTVKVQLPAEKVRDWTGLTDTLHLSTSVADAKAWIDTSKCILAGELKNKERPLDAAVPSTTITEVRDSLVYKEIPLEVPVEKIVKKVPWFWKTFGIIGMILSFLILLYIGLKIYIKFYKPI